MNFSDSEKEMVLMDLVVVLRKRIEKKLWPSFKDVRRRPGWGTKTLDDMFGLILNKEIPIYYQDQTQVVIKDNIELIKITAAHLFSLKVVLICLSFDLSTDKEIIENYYQLIDAFPFITFKLEEVEDFERRHGM